MEVKLHTIPILVKDDIISVSTTYVCSMKYGNNLYVWILFTLWVSMSHLLLTVPHW